MSKYSEKKERQRKEQAALEEAERVAERAAKRDAKIASARAEKVEKIDETSMAERMAKSAHIISVLKREREVIVAQITTLDELKNNSKCEERSHYFAALGLLTAARDKVAGAMANLEMASLAAGIRRAI